MLNYLLDNRVLYKSSFIISYHYCLLQINEIECDLKYQIISMLNKCPELCNFLYTTGRNMIEHNVMYSVTY